MFCFLKSLMNLSAGLQKGGKSKMISVALKQFSWRNLKSVWVLLYIQQFLRVLAYLDELAMKLKKMNFFYISEYENSSFQSLIIL